MKSKKLILVLVLFTTGFFFSWRSTSVQLGLTPDSAYYLSLADGLRSGRGFVSYEYGSSVTFYPPGYPAALGAMTFLGPDLRLSGRLWNAVLLGLLASLVLLLLWETTRSLATGMVGGVITLASRDMLWMHSMIWTEPLFDVLVVLFLYVFWRFTGSNRRILWFASVLVAALCAMVKYSGVATVFTGAAVLLLERRPFKERLSKAVGWSAASLAPLSLWLLRNRIAHGTLFLSRNPDSYAFSSANTTLAKSTLLDWTGFPNGIYPALILFFFAGQFLLPPARDFVRQEATRNCRRIILFFLLFYVLFLSGGVFAYGLDKPFDGRAFAPAYVPAVLAVLMTASLLAGRSPADASKKALYTKVAGVLCLVYFVWIGAINASRSGVTIVPWLFLISGSLLLYEGFRPAASRVGLSLVCLALTVLIGVGLKNMVLFSNPYMVRGYRKATGAQVLSEVAVRSPGETIISNAGDYVYLFTNLDCLNLPPSTERYGTGSQVQNYPQLVAKLLNHKDALLVFIPSLQRNYLPSESQLVEWLPLTLLARTEDGAIYRIDTKRVVQ